MPLLSEAKQLVAGAVDAMDSRLREVALNIHANPELGYEERNAVSWLTQLLGEAGFLVDRGVGGLETAFKASWKGTRPGPVIGFLAEYDAMRGLGHACGHNIIGAAAVGAALACKQACPDLPGEIVVFGTPAEEDGGGKVQMVDAGVFNGVDACMMVHPMMMNIISPGMLACVDVTFKFYGKPAHAAAAPHRGVSALDAMILAFVAINGMRQFLRDGNRVHGIITKGGDAPNIVPDYCEAAFIVRSPTVVELAEVKKKVYQAARGAAESMGARFEYVEGLTYAELNNNVALGRLFTQNMRQIGIEMVEPRSPGAGGSSDIGNVSQVTAAIHPYVKISDTASNHTPEFCEAAASEQAMQALHKSAKAMAMTALDMLLDEAAYNAVREEFLAWKAERE